MEDKVLAAMKTLAVREENVMVARVTLHEGRGEPILSYGARLRGQAGESILFTFVDSIYFTFVFTVNFLETTCGGKPEPV